jgi:septal ring factor EnvC (AmiA/AmiB activator)
MFRRLAPSFVLIAAALAAAVGIAAPAIVPAVRQMEADQQAREHERDAALAEAQAARGQIAQLQAQLNALDAAQRGDAAVSQKRLELAALTVRETDLRARMGGDQNQLARLLTVLEVFRRDPPPALLVDPHDVRDAVRAAILVKAMTPALAARAEALRLQARDLQRLRRQVDTASETLITSESDLAEQRAHIESEIAAQTAVVRQALTDASAAGQDADTLAGRNAALRDLAQGLGAPTAADQAPPPPDPEHDGLFGRPKLFVAPVPGPPARKFGAEDPGGSTRSQGWTWRTVGGPAVSAPAQGVVDYAGPVKGFGVVLILRLGGGYHLVLAGLDSISVAPGQSVAAGSTIGQMAKGAAPEELYFEIRKNGAPIDPAHWMAGAPQLADRR